MSKNKKMCVSLSLSLFSPIVQHVRNPRSPGMSASLAAITRQIPPLYVPLLFTFPFSLLKRHHRETHEPTASQGTAHITGNRAPVHYVYMQACACALTNIPRGFLSAMEIAQSTGSAVIIPCPIEAISESQLFRRQH